MSSIDIGTTASPPKKRHCKTITIPTTNTLNDKQTINGTGSTMTGNSTGNAQNGHHSDAAQLTRQSTDGSFDANLYSRMLYTLGHTAMTRLRHGHVLIAGLGGVGVEVAKNLILGGVRHDTKHATYNDLASQYYLSPASIGANRAEQSLSALAELNDSVTVECKTTPLTDELVANFDLIILTDASLDEQLKVNSWTRAHNKKLLIVDCRGLFAQIFNDFGPSFTIDDANGEETHEVLLEYIIKSTGVIGMLEDAKHNLEDGDYVQFSEVKGMVELNTHAPIKVTTKNPSTITVDPALLANMSDYTGGGRLKLVKMPKTISFKPLNIALTDENFDVVYSDYAKMDRAKQLHGLWQGLHAFVKEHGRLPAPCIEADAHALHKLSHMSDEDAKLVSLFASHATGNVCAMTSFIGGVAAQEAMKAITGIFTPIMQWFYFDALECLPGPWSPYDVTNLTSVECAPRNDRYDGYRAVFGSAFVEVLKAQRWFIVGAGAIGSELLKNFAMTGLACGDGGEIRITDMDNIELSNLNRQFLFRRHDIGKKKAEVAAAAARAMNGDLHVRCMAERVCGETENIFNDEFFTSLNGVANALDNVEARQYMDRRCVYYCLPLLESGTLGAKGNVQVVFPHATESYSSSADPPEKSIPICTLKNFPNAIEHTIQWARELFTGLYTNPAETANSWLADVRAFNERADKMHSSQKLEVLSDVRAALISNRPKSADDTVRWARDLFEDHFSNTIRQLLHNFPPDQTTSQGTPFWSGAKRCPHPIVFDLNNQEHFDFIYSAALLRAQEYQLQPIIDRDAVRALLTAYVPPAFVPRSGVRIAVTDAEAAAGNEAGADSENVDEQITAVQIKLAQYRTTKDSSLMQIDFEKDDPTNYHMEFVTCASNLRAECYDIPKADVLKTKQIAGRIIPAIATTTAAVAGLVCLELYKVVAAGNERPSRVPLEVFKNGFLNLALPFFAFSEPIAPPKKEVSEQLRARTHVFQYSGRAFTLWDSLPVRGPATLQQIKDHLANEYSLDMSMVSSGVSLLYSFFMAADKQQARLAMTMPELVRSVTQRQLPAHVYALVIEVMTTAIDSGDDVDIPYIKYILSEEERQQIV